MKKDEQKIAIFITEPRTHNLMLLIQNTSRSWEEIE